MRRRGKLSSAGVYAARAELLMCVFASVRVRSVGCGCERERMSIYMHCIVMHAKIVSVCPGICCGAQGADGAGAGSNSLRNGQGA